MRASPPCWEVPDQKLRVRTAIQIANVQSLQIKNINQHYAGGIASILAMKFEPKDTPKDTLEGNLRIIFSGGGEIRLAVEACEAILEDISDAWAAQSRPSHEFD
jgi:di/tripeptidase